MEATVIPGKDELILVKQHTDRIPVLRVCGVIQSIIGLICVVISSVSVSRDPFSGTTGLEVACLVLCFWFILTGLFPLFMLESRKSFWKGLKISFMVCSILSAAVFVPALIILELILLISISLQQQNAVLQVVVMSFASLEFIMAVISASICCCCSSIDGYWVRKSTDTVEVAATQHSNPSNRENVSLPTDHFTVLSYEEPANHSDVYDEIEDRYYESLGERNDKRYDHLTQTDRQPRTRDTNESVSSQTVPKEIADHQPNTKYEKLNRNIHDKQYDQLTQADRNAGEIDDRSGGGRSSQTNPAKITDPQQSNKYLTLYSDKTGEQQKPEDVTIETQRYSYLDATSGVKQPN